jgi:hypothetical protein
VPDGREFWIGANVGRLMDETEGDGVGEVGSGLKDGDKGGVGE